MAERRRHYVLRLDPVLVERVEQQVIKLGIGGYSDLSDFVATAVRNQLVLESPSAGTQEWPLPHNDTKPQTGVDIERGPTLLLGMPSREPSPTVRPAQTGTPFFVLTNRLAPMALATRVLANLAGESWPPVGVFLSTGAASARTLGLRLRAEDQHAGRRGLSRRFVGWPVGDDEAKALARFRESFLLWPDTGSGQGPLAECGLAAVVDGMAALTDLGARLARAPSPMLEEADGWTLGDEQQAILREAVYAMPGEREEVALFMAAVREAHGEQARLDAFLRAGHPSWTENRATAHRAAMLGRLRELGVVDVNGWGPKARITICQGAEAFANDVTGTNVRAEA